MAGEDGAEVPVSLHVASGIGGRPPATGRAWGTGTADQVTFTAAEPASLSRAGVEPGQQQRGNSSLDTVGTPL